MRLFESQEYGPCIGLLDENGEVATSLPVAMFPEVTEFLVTQGVIEGRRPSTSPSLPKPVAKLSAPVARPSLPKPRLVQSKQSVNPLKPSREVVIVDLENDTGGTEEEDTIRQIQEAVEGSSPATSLVTKAEQSPVISDEEARLILEERQNAMKKAQTAAKRIRKKSDEDEE